MSKFRPENDSEAMKMQQPSPPYLAEVLYLAAQTMGKSLDPIEINFWSETLSKEPEGLVRRAFREHLQTEKFFPKPAEIIARIKQYRAETITGYTPIDREATDAHQATPEWQEASDRARAKLRELFVKKAMP